MISSICIMLAAICNAIMDTCAHHYEKSIFTKYNPQFWDASISWKNKYVDWDNGNTQRVKLIGQLNKPVSMTDSWHLFKRLMILLMLGGIIFYDWNADSVYMKLLNFGILLIVWNATFHYFYHYFLLKTPKQLKNET